VKLLSPERRRSAVVDCGPCLGFLTVSPAVLWASTAAPSAMAARSSILRRPTSGVAYGQSQLSTSLGGVGWPIAY